MRIGVLTGGGDSPGLNAAIRAIVKRAGDYDIEVLGLRHGWSGLLDRDAMLLRWGDLADAVGHGGTILKTSRTNPLAREEGLTKLLMSTKALGLDAIIAIGGEDTLGVAAKLAREGIPVVGVPKTIDFDLPGTEGTIGFDTAVNVAVEAIDRIHTTSESHDRVLVVEVMGRTTGWIAAHAGLAGGAHLILVPEEPFTVDSVAAFVGNRQATGRRSTVIVVAEGARLADEAALATPEVDEFGHPRLAGIGEFLAREIARRTGAETRSVSLGHMLRGGAPSAFDRVLGTRLGIAAVDLVRDRRFGLMVSWRNGGTVPVPLDEALKPPRSLDADTLAAIRVMQG